MSKLGTISSVEVNHDDHQIDVSVVTGPDTEHVEIRYLLPGNGVWIVPEVGDIVEVREIGSDQYVARPLTPGTTLEMPGSLSDGDFAARLNENTLFYFSQQGNGTYNVELAADGEITIESDQVITTSDIVVDGNLDATTATVDTAPSNNTDVVRKVEIDAIESDISALQDDVATLEDEVDSGIGSHDHSGSGSGGNSLAPDSVDVSGGSQLSPPEKMAKSDLSSGDRGFFFIHDDDRVLIRVDSP